MLRIDRQQKALTAMTGRSLGDAGLKERDDLQQLIRQNPETFFAEMGEELLLVGEEVYPTEIVDDRIDLLAVDKNGAAVVIELKRGSSRYQLLQALSYAAMISKWDGQQLIQTRSKLEGVSLEQAEEQIEEHLGTEVSELNRQQRVVLLAERFDYEVLATAEWLNEQYGVGVRCYQLKLATHGEHEYLNCTCVYPLPELRDYVQVGPRGTSKRRWTDWEAALKTTDNEALTAFFLAEINAGREDMLNKRCLVFRVDGKRRWSVSVRRTRAYVWQRGRFERDVEFWQQRLGPDLEINPVADERSLRFYLATKEQFDSFAQALERELADIEFFYPDEPADADEED